MPDRESPFSCRDCHGVNSHDGGGLKRKIVGEASESVDGENEVKDGERVHESKRHEEEKERGREGGREGERERDRKEQREEDSQARQTG